MGAVMNKKAKITIKAVGLFLLAAVIVFGVYAFYVFNAYYRLPDKLTLEVKRNGENSYFDENFVVALERHISL